MAVDHIRFTQWSIKDVFSNGAPVATTIKQVCRGEISHLDIPPIDIAYKDGVWWASSNRRLFVFKHLGLPAMVRIRPWDREFEGKWRNGLRTRQTTLGMRVAVRMTSRDELPPSHVIDYDNSFSEVVPTVYTCGVCRRDFASAPALRQHEDAKAHFVCSCGKRCGSRYSLHQHKRDARHHGLEDV